MHPRRYPLVRPVLLQPTRALDFLAPLAIRLYLVPVLWMAGTKKLANFESTVEWFGIPDAGLGLPFPTLMAFHNQDKAGTADMTRPESRSTLIMPDMWRFAPCTSALPKPRPSFPA